MAVGNLNRHDVVAHCRLGSMNRSAGRPALLDLPISAAYLTLNTIPKMEFSGAGEMRFHISATGKRSLRCLRSQNGVRSQLR